MEFSGFKHANEFELHDHFSSKNLDDLSIEELAYIHLNRTHHQTIVKNVSVSSSLYDLIETAQASAINARTRIYTPMLASFAVLDQIGSAYRSKSKSTNYQNGIKVALQLFGTHTKDEIEYLTTLRNGLYHDGSLISKNINGKTNVVFRLDPNAPQTITMPRKPWDGVYHDSLSDYISKINVLSFKNDVEKISMNCLDLLLNEKLNFEINDKREFFYKFLFASPKAA
jgi:hypothetical protein